MAGAASTLKPSPAFFFFFLPLFFLLKFLTVCFFFSLILVMVLGDRARPCEDLLLTLEMRELRTVLTDLDLGFHPRGVLRLLPHSRGVEFLSCRALQLSPLRQLPLSQNLQIIRRPRGVRGVPGAPSFPFPEPFRGDRWVS
jgi:hypothetical protein